MWASLGAPGGQGISTGPSTYEEQWGSLEKCLGARSRATCYLGNEMLPNWIQEFTRWLSWQGTGCTNWDTITGYIIQI